MGPNVCTRPASLKPQEPGGHTGSLTARESESIIYSFVLQLLISNVTPMLFLGTVVREWLNNTRDEIIGS